MSNMTTIKCTSLKEVYELLGNIPVIVSYVIDQEFGDSLTIEAAITEKRKEKLKEAGYETD